MDNVADLIAVTKPDPIAKVVLNDSEVVPVVVDISREICSVPPANNQLLVAARGPPINFQFQLIRLHEARRIGESFTNLSEKENEPMGSSRIVNQIRSSNGLITTLGSCNGQRSRLLRIPFLTRKVKGRNQDRRRQNKRNWPAATVLIAALCSCESVVSPIDETLSTAELLILAVQAAGGTVGEESFYVVNSRVVTHRLLHADQFNTQYVEIRFPVGSIQSVGGGAVGPQDSVLVTVRPRAGQYGITVSPTSLVFSAGNLPRATFTYAVYGDRSVADGSATYATREAYSAALDVWEQVSTDQWTQSLNSSALVDDEVSASLSAGGVHVVAAPR